MTAAVLTRPFIPTPRVSTENLPRRTAAVGYQEVLHRMVRREFRLLAELAGWAHGGRRRSAPRSSRGTPT